MKPLLKNNGVRGAVSVEREPPMLSPALSRLKFARSKLDVHFILDGVPSVIYGPLAVHMSSRPAKFNPDIVAEVVRVAGRDRIAKVAGKRGASNVITRFMPGQGL